MWDSMPVGMAYPLTFKLIEDVSIMFLCYISLKNFTITTVTIVQSVSPFFILAFGYFMLKEKIVTSKVVMLSSAFIGILFIAFFGHSEPPNAKTPTYTSILILCSLPIISSLGLIAL